MENNVKGNDDDDSVAAKNLYPFNPSSPFDTRSTTFKSIGNSFLCFALCGQQNVNLLFTVSLGGNGMAASGGFPLKGKRQGGFPCVS